MPLSNLVNDIAPPSIEERVATLEQAIMEILICLGMRLTKNDEGQLGFRIETVGPKEGWGILARIMHDIGEIKNEKRIIIPGRH